MDSNRISATIQARVEKHRQQLAHLESCYRDEMAKKCYLRNVFSLFFLWSEMSILHFAVNELQGLSSELVEYTE
jgi:hypothetical protein